MAYFYCRVFNSSIQVKKDQQTEQIVSLDAQFHGEAMEAYTAHGCDLRNPVQILEPARVSLYYKSALLHTHKSTCDVRAVALTPLDFSLSMRNVALVNAILQSVSECFHDSSSDSDMPEDVPESLSLQETQHIEQLAQALQSNEPEQSIQPSSFTDGVPVDSSPSESMTQDTDNATMNCTTSVKITLPETSITIINDLQGLDEALLRATLQNMMVGAQIREGECLPGTSLHYTGFEVNLHTSVVADYFDAPSNLWKSLLVKPWEVSSRNNRGPNNRFQSKHPSSTFDIESYPCFMRFSEQFLMNLASANRMWQVYSTATTSAQDSKPSPSRPSRPSRTSLRKSIAASAAR